MTIRLAFFSVNDLPNDLNELIRALPFGEDDRQRLLAIKNDDALRHSIAARMALLSLCSDGDRTISRTEHGKPYFSEADAPHFSLSHAKGLAVAALSEEPCGVDLEAFRERLNENALAERFFSKNDQAALKVHGDFFALWTKKEAISKCLGTPLTETIGKECSLPTRTYRDGSFTLSVAAEQEFSIEFSKTSFSFSEVLL